MTTEPQPAESTPSGGGGDHWLHDWTLEDLDELHAFFGLGDDWLDSPVRARIKRAGYSARTPTPSGGGALTDDEREDYEWMVRSLLGLLDRTSGDTVRKAQVRGIIETTMPLAARTAQPSPPTGPGPVSNRALETSCGTCFRSGWYGSRQGVEHRHCHCGRPCRVCVRATQST